MTGLSLRAALADDIPFLALLNQQLLEDEKHPVQRDLADLEARHRAWMAAAEWWQDILEKDGVPVGYIAYRPEPEPQDFDVPEVHLRQFGIARGERGKGYGRAGFELFLKTRLAPGTRLTLDVLESNPSGQAFWRAMGTTPFFHRMELITG